jgi:hypothetical protein
MEKLIQIMVEALVLSGQNYERIQSEKESSWLSIKDQLDHSLNILQESLLKTKPRTGLEGFMIVAVQSVESCKKISNLISIHLQSTSEAALQNACKEVITSAERLMSAIQSI